MTSSQIEELLGDNAKTLLDHKCTTIDASMLHLPGPDFNERIVAESDRSAQVMRNLQQMWDHGRLGGTGYLSILPVDQGIEHSAGASFAPNPEYFDPGKIVELAVRNVVHGRPVKNVEALANAEALEEYKNRPELAQ